MSTFMQPQITPYESWLVIDGPEGTEYIEADFIKCPSLGGFKEDKRQQFKECDEYWQYLFAQAESYRRNRKAYEIRWQEGYGVRFSAPGYTDCTDWTVFDTKEEATAYLFNECLEDDPDAEVTFTADFNDHSISGDVINPGGWFGKTWLVGLGCGYSCTFVIVEADNIQDAIDELSGNEKYKHHILITEEDYGDYGLTIHKGDMVGGKTYDHDCFINLRGEEVAKELPEPHYNDRGEPCDLDNIQVYGEEGMVRGKGMPFHCVYHLQGLDISPLALGR